MTGFKWINPKRRSFYDGEFGPWAVGKTLSVPDATKGDVCGHGLHIGKTANDAIGYGKFPGRLYSVIGVGECLGEDATKARFASVKVLEELKKPSWVLETEDFIESIARVKWFKPGGRKPKPEWAHHESRAAAWAAAGAAALAAARDAAWAAAGDAAGDAARYAARYAAGAAALAAASDAAWAAAGDAAGDAARYAALDAALMARVAVVSDLDFKDAEKHRKHARDRWEVWTMGYALALDVNGKLYTHDGPKPRAWKRK